MIIYGKTQHDRTTWIHTHIYISIGFVQFGDFHQSVANLVGDSISSSDFISQLG
jgi:hypothetical protein